MVGVWAPVPRSQSERPTPPLPGAQGSTNLSSSFFPSLSTFLHHGSCPLRLAVLQFNPKTGQVVNGENGQI